MKRGTKLIVVDPRLTWLASRAEIWLQLRPGTDAALALGMLNVIINEELYDREFVEKWCHGFDELKERVQSYPVQKVSEITWVPKEKIEAAARFYAKSKPAAIEIGFVNDATKESIPLTHAHQSLWAITGNLDVPGGNVIGKIPFGVTAQAFGWKFEMLPPEQRMKMIGINDYPLIRYVGYTVVQADIAMLQMLTGKPYPIKAAWVQTSNPIAATACGGARQFYEGFKKLDFTVVVDLFMTPTAMLADIVLPAATFAERNSFTGKPGHPFGTINKALTVEECKSDWEINLELARRFNPEACRWKNVEELLDEALRPSGMSFSELREKGWLYEPMEYRKHERGLLRGDEKPGFNTPTGKFDLYATRLRDFGLDPLPYFEEPPESPISTPELAKDYPLILTTGARSYAYFHSEHRQIPWLREINPNPIVEIHPDTAKSIGLADGDWVCIENKWGRCKQKARLTLGIHPRVVSAQHGWWFPEKPGSEPSLFGVWESNSGLLLPPYGSQGRAGVGYPIKASLCKVYKAAD
jgi:anaerobic selenocysteine-containing dehydrogenase